MWAQIENIDSIQAKRIELWNTYYHGIKSINSHLITLPTIPDYATKKGHMFYITTTNVESRTKLISKLKENGFLAVFHYISLHSSPYYISKYEGNELINSDKFTNCLLRLPLFYELTVKEIEKLILILKTFN